MHQSKLITPEILEAQYKLLVETKDLTRASQGRTVVSIKELTPTTSEIVYAVLYQKDLALKTLKLHTHLKDEFGGALDAMANLSEKNSARQLINNRYAAYSKMVDTYTAVKKAAKW